MTAYAEAVDVAGAHQSSYGREAAGVFAAAVAAAMTPGASVEDVVQTCLDCSHDGTRAAIDAVCREARALSDWQSALPRLRAAVAPFDSVGEDYRRPGLDARRPSRTRSIEELPVALGLLVVTGGAFPAAVLGAVNYGRDADSIATMAGAVSGALGGREAVPAEWRDAVAASSRLDLETVGHTMAEVAAEVFDRDSARAAQRAERMRALRSPVGDLVADGVTACA